VAQAEVYYALWDLGGEAPPLDEDTAATWRDTAVSGAGIAAEALLWETLGRSEPLDGAVRFLRTFVSPNLAIERRPSGWNAKVNDPEVRLRPAIERAEFSQGLTGPPPRAPSLSIGSGLDVREPDPLVERTRVLDFAAWLRLSRFGIDQLTVRGLVRSRAWELSARQRVAPRVSASVAAASREADPLPRDLGAALTWTLPRGRWWTLSLRRRQELLPPPGSVAERTWTLAVRWSPPARAPVQVDRWPLGQRVGSPGPVLPAPAPGAPIETRLPTGSSAAPR